ncbi:MAG TPA: ATP-grasp domain-containing protein, partial [Phototrophicaceae bacterium]|nr:ATP-grasp domain-containing protein [Phototrophicaceae bacterium]
KSNKEQGLKAVVAQNLDELKRLTESVLANPHRSRGKVIIRELVSLRCVYQAVDEFPISREYRVFVHRNEVIAYSFYWDEFEDVEPLSSQDKRLMLSLALETAARLQVPFIAVDLAQTADGNWIVIETGDAQFCGLSHVPVLELWSKIKDFG